METGVIFTFETEYGDGVQVDVSFGNVGIYQYSITSACADSRGFIGIPADVWPAFAEAVTALLARNAAEVQE